VKRIALIFAFVIPSIFSVAPTAIGAQSYSSSTSFVAADPDPNGAEGQTASPLGRRYSGGSEGPLSRLALGAGISPLGIQLQAATNVNGHLNVRATGNLFNYTDTFITDGITANAKLNLSSAGAYADFYPFHSGFRLSPGVLFMNQNQITAVTDVQAGTSFTLNGSTYYSANANALTGATPVVGTGTLNLHTTKPAFAVTAGWGNMARGDHHWSFPVDVGVAFIGDPSIKVNLSGWACYDQAQTECTDISDPNNPIAIAVQSNLTAQVAKWTNDLSPLKTYPILSAGVAYSFHVR
jgi:hypothetical protein